MPPVVYAGNLSASSRYTTYGRLSPGVRGGAAVSIRHACGAPRPQRTLCGTLPPTSQWLPVGTALLLHRIARGSRPAITRTVWSRLCCWVSSVRLAPRWSPAHCEHTHSVLIFSSSYPPPPGRWNYAEGWKQAGAAVRGRRGKRLYGLYLKERSASDANARATSA